MTNRIRNKRRKVDICDKYRRILKMARLINKEIDEMREQVSLLVRAICERVWGKKPY